MLRAGMPARRLGALCWLTAPEQGDEGVLEPWRCGLEGDARQRWQKRLEVGWGLAIHYQSHPLALDECIYDRGRGSELGLDHSLTLPRRRQ